MKQGAAIPTILEYITQQAWAVEPAILQEMAGIVERHIEGILAEEGAIEAITAPKIAKGSNERKYELTADGRAIIPISGVIAKYARMVNGVSQPRGTSVEAIGEQIEQAVSDRAVTSLLLHIESPGGSIAGLADLAGDIYQASQAKPVVAYIDDLGASAAYWLAAQANMIWANQTAQVGSIGVYTLYMDSTRWAERQGLKFHILRSGEHKGVGELGIAITESNLTAIQARIDAYHEMFIASVLRGRREMGLDDAELRAIADGRVFLAEEAKRLKLIDGIGTLAAVRSADLPAARRTDIAASGGTDANNSFKEFEMSEKEKAEEKAGDEQIRLDSAAAERGRITAIQSALAGEAFDEVRTKAIAQGLTLTEAKAVAFETAIEAGRKEAAALRAQLDEARARLDAIAAGGSDATAQQPCDAEEEAAPAADDGKGESYERAVADLQARGLSKAKAMREAAVKFPKAHTAWRKNQLVIAG